MNLSFKLLVAAAVFATSFTVGAQTIFSTSGYSTGEALEKPILCRNLEFLRLKARKSI